jgi:hypothetical protein
VLESGLGIGVVCGCWRVKLCVGVGWWSCMLELDGVVCGCWRVELCVGVEWSCVWVFESGVGCWSCVLELDVEAVC